MIVFGLHPMLSSGSLNYRNWFGGLVHRWQSSSDFLLFSQLYSSRSFCKPAERAADSTVVRHLLKRSGKRLTTYDALH
jgi:hypothetical protein